MVRDMLLHVDTPPCRDTNPSDAGQLARRRFIMQQPNFEHPFTGFRSYPLGSGSNVFGYDDHTLSIEIRMPQYVMHHGV